MKILICVLWSLILAAAPVLAAPHPSIPSGPIPNGLGINIHFTEPLPGEMELLAATGAKWIRMDWGWGRTEREKGVYDFSQPDKLVAALEKHGLRAVFVLSYGNKLYSPTSPATPQSRAAFTRWAVAATKHFQNRGILWEMWNEPNGFWTPAPNAADYAVLAREVGAAFEREVPGEALIGPALARFDWPFFEAAFAGGILPFFDGVSVHPYRSNAPDSAAPDYGKLRDLIRKYSPEQGKMPILAGEWGYDSALGRRTEEQQARFLARQWLTNIASGVPLSIWYDWRDDGDDPKNAEHRFGLVRRSHLPNQRVAFHPKPSFFAAQTLIRALSGYEFEKRLATGDEADWVLQFRRGKQIKIAAWTAKTNGKIVKLPFGSDLSAADLLGRGSSALKSQNGTVRMPLSPAVTYFSPQIR